MNLRPAQAEDIPAMVALWREMVAFHAARGPFFPLAPDADRLYADYLAHIISSRHDWIAIIALEDETPLGFGSATIRTMPDFFTGARFGYIDDVIITASARGKGVGHAIVEQIETWMRGKSITRIDLRATVTNDVSQAFWARQGFQPELITFTKTLE